MSKGADEGMADSLPAVAEEVKHCVLCPLSRKRTLAVPGEGPENASIMLIGEGPGFHEDQQGRPFVGVSGQYLEQLLAGIGLRRNEVFITNVVKCRPPDNRDPEPGELLACRGYLERQLSLLQARIVVTLGRFSMERFFPGQSITRIHGHPRRSGQTFYLPMFHPAAALRRVEWKQQMSEDFAQIPHLMEILERERNPLPKSTPKSPADDFEQLSLF
jgi:uracil-DNA glycosylase